MTFASGLRNAIGNGFYPGTNDYYVVVNERDGYGDDLVPDYFTRVEEGDFFGWPYAYAGGIEDAKFSVKRPDMVAKTKLPDVLFQAHSAPVGLVFYTGQQFPEEYQGDAFVSLHGSWNRSQPTGYKVVRIRFEDGRPIGGYENFLTGFLRDADAVKPEKPHVTGRPAGLAQMPDGSLLLAEDGNNTILRISYVGK
jgi:glucose/arabinose dehydrogenase